MSERPILFSAPMVRAILAGTKTQTRRVVKGWPLEWLEPPINVSPEYVAHPDNHACPYGQPGDRLWVREAWGYFDPDGRGDGVAADRRGGEPWAPDLMQEGHPLRNYWRRRVAYKATFAGDKYGAGPVGPDKWRPSIHMPRWASRITLEVTAVRVERLQDISEADAVAEGTPCYVCGRQMDGLGEDDCHCFHTRARPSDYRMLWEQINGPGSWDANPWVWVLKFRRLETGNE